MDSGITKLSQEVRVESLMMRHQVQSAFDISASPGDDLGPERDDESGGNWPKKAAVGSLSLL